MYPGKLLRLLQPGKTFTKISIFLPQQPVFPVQIPALRFQLLQTLLQPEAMRPQGVILCLAVLTGRHLTGQFSGRRDFALTGMPRPVLLPILLSRAVRGMHAPHPGHQLGNIDLTFITNS